MPLSLVTLKLWPQLFYPFLYRRQLGLGNRKPAPSFLAYLPRKSLLRCPRAILSNVRNQLVAFLDATQVFVLDFGKLLSHPPSPFLGRGFRAHRVALR